ncbi:Leucine-rich repeat (LRR) protein associated with apoptosis in muscle tissue protein [Dioscorea alata]|uniref:Leucine-rich repeat (LRR) protein associated with apoptosis in muscle tissue protein n=2 Tax=Dioscorea alata TaxID=55571 RepID=A0ACB7UJD3_DIOAL|nr:Leucine-rich repeat (LRR) protein associated with apoptosis in muscle tissue protein [Dioscorea alata]KAH7660367.1 Leucine-rich repeat (LRR) protein associated with apoptosis in muscle tissue protein [Dioscorea alata]
MGLLSQSIDEIVQEIMTIHRSLPPRPCIDEVEAAVVLVRNLEQEEQSRIDAIARQKKAFEVPDELFSVLQEMQRSLVFFQCKEQKREAVKLLDLENIHQLFDELIQRASSCVPSSSNGSSGSISMSSTSTVTASGSHTGFDSSSSTVSSALYPERTVTRVRSFEQVTRDDSYLGKMKSTVYTDGNGLELNNKPQGGLFVNPTLKLSAIPPPLPTSGGIGNEKLSLIKVASVIEVSSKKGTKDLNLQNKLMDQIDWLPDSIGKLSDLVTLDLSENRLLVLPVTIGTLSSLTRLDLHSNRIAELPDSIGDLLSLQYLDLKGNQLTKLPSTIGKLANLVELDLSSNQLSVLTEAIGRLISLKKLSVETNNLEELPHTIGNCASLVELRVDYNRLRGLPEAVGRLSSLEVLSVRYNNIKSLPTSMASLLKLKELDASFNELESIP